jgi:hypothetical protein
MRYLQGMSSGAHKIIEGFYALPEDQQVEVLEAIVPDDDDFDPAYLEELQRRVRSIEDGSAVLLDGDEVLARLRTKLAAG